MKNICVARLSLLLAILPVSGQAQFTFFTSGGTITITGYIGPISEVNIPSTMNGLPVTGIWLSAFLAKSSLTSVTIPDSVITISDRAFQQCTSLTNVSLRSRSIPGLPQPYGNHDSR